MKKRATNINKKSNPKGLKKNEYDAIVVGAGIGGLVCGCYLAKAGKKVLIVEKNAKAGGYCTSFNRKNFVFDSCIHSLGNCGNDSLLGKVISDFELGLKIVQADPSDVVISPEYKIEVGGDIKKATAKLKRYFPTQKKIDDFFALIDSNHDALLYLRLKEKTFNDLLCDYFSDKKIKAFFEIFLANIGISSSSASAFTAILFLKSFVFNGGYYPVGGMQCFADAFVDCFLSMGGELILSREVKKIAAANGKTTGISLENGDFFNSKFVVSNIDTNSTFLKLLPSKYTPISFKKKLKGISPSASAFIVYLGLKNSSRQKLDSGYFGVWNMPEDYDMKRTLQLPLEEKIIPNEFLFFSNPSSIDKTLAKGDYEVARLIVNAPFKNTAYWKKNKDPYTDQLLDTAAKLFPDLKDRIVFKEAATPQTLHNFTGNYKGAMCGLLNTIDQNEYDFPKNHGVQNLYLVGHWVPEKYGQGGVAMAAYSGKKVATKIINKPNLS